MNRRLSKQVKAGGLLIGGDAPVSIQSMLNTPSYDVKGSVQQAIALQEAGCEMIRVAIPDMNAVKIIPAIKECVKVPLVADIHFDYRLAVESVAAGIDKIRINPGNIGDDSRIKIVAETCREKGIPIRIGVNSGSCEKDILAKYGAPTADALVESARYHVQLLEKLGFEDIVVSIKSSSVPIMFEAYKKAAEIFPYPLHLGVTEAGTEKNGIILSSAGIGGLLLNGIGDTIRVSLTDDPIKEVRAAKDILKAVGLRRQGVRIISCPTCGRTRINLIELAKKAEEMLYDCEKDITVAIMGCVVNGPGEAKEADIGIAGGENCGLIFKKGKVVKKVAEQDLLSELIKEIERL